MKIIGICGNYGKTTTCEMLYQYLLNKGYKVGVCSSNGVFYNNITLEKNIFSCMCSKKYIDQLPKDLDYLVLEINEESIYAKKVCTIYQEEFECLCNVTYDKKLCDKHIEYPDFLFKIFTDINAKHKLCFEKDKEIIGFEETYKLVSNINYSFNNTTFKISTQLFNSKFLNMYEMIDLSAMIGILKTIKEYDKICLQTTLDNLLIRGHMETYIINNKKVILDTGWFRIDELLNNTNCIDLNNLELILLPFPEDARASNTTKEWREATGNYLREKNIHVILTGNYQNEENLYKELYKYNNYEYIPNIEEAINTSLLKDKEYIYIMGNYRFRDFREILNTINEVK